MRPGPISWRPIKLTLNLAELPFEVEVEIEPRHAQDVRQQQLNLQTGRFHAFLAEEFRAALNDIEDGHSARLG